MSPLLCRRIKFCLSFSLGQARIAVLPHRIVQSMTSEVKQNMCNNNNNCVWLILIVILIVCCCGGYGSGCGSSCGCGGNCGCGSNCGGGNDCCC